MTTFDKHCSGLKQTRRKYRIIWKRWDIPPRSDENRLLFLFRLEILETTYYAAIRKTWFCLIRDWSANPNKSSPCGLKSGFRTVIIFFYLCLNQNKKYLMYHNGVKWYLYGGGAILNPERSEGFWSRILSLARQPRVESWVQWQSFSEKNFFARSVVHTNHRFSRNNWVLLFYHPVYPTVRPTVALSCKDHPRSRNTLYNHHNYINCVYTY